MKALFLYLLSVLLTPTFSIIGIVYGLIVNPKGFRDKLYKMAQSNDRFVNVTCEELFNKTMITEDAIYKFGDGRETISSAIGRNFLTNTLTKFGRWWDNYLNKVDPGHTKNAIGWRKSNK
jgi:hypothetical protein